MNRRIIRRSNRNSRRRGRQAPILRSLHSMSGATVVPVRFLFTSNISSSASTTMVTEFNLTAANMGDRAADFADCFLYWRATAANFRQILECGASSATVVSPPGAYLHSVAWVPISDVDTTTPTTFNALEYPGFQLTCGTLTCTLRQRRPDMKTVSPWLTTSTTPDAILQCCGTITTTTISGPIADATSAAIARGDCEIMLVFRTPAATQVTPLRSSPLAPVIEAMPTRIVEIFPDRTRRVILDKRRETTAEFLQRRASFGQPPTTSSNNGENVVIVDHIDYGLNEEKEGNSKVYKSLPLTPLPHSSKVVRR